MTLKVAVIGAGAMGANHLRIYSKLKNTELVAVVDANAQLAEKAGKEFKCKHYPSIAAMLAEQKPDAASLVVPTKLHFSLAKQLIEAGIPTLVEKPITFTKEEGAQLIAISKKHKVMIMPGQVERFNPVVPAAYKAISEGKIGKPVSFLFRRIGLFPSRVKDINVIQDIGVHDIDLLHYFTRAPLVLKGASAGSAFITGRYDSAQMVFQAGTASAVLECNWITPTRVREFDVVGTNGMLRASLINQTLQLYPTVVERDKQGNVEKILDGVKSIEIKVEKIEPLKLELEHFLQCVKNNTHPVVTAEEAVYAVELANEVTNSLMKRYAVKKILRRIGLPDKLTNKVIKQN